LGESGRRILSSHFISTSFWDETLDQYKERFIRENPDIPNEEFTDCKFVLENGTEMGLIENDFEEIRTLIRKGVSKEPNLQQLVREGRDLKKKT